MVCSEIVILEVQITRTFYHVKLEGMQPFVLQPRVIRNNVGKYWH